MIAHPVTVAVYSAMPPPFAAYNTNFLLGAVAALSAAIAFVSALHLYARCLLQRRASSHPPTSAAPHRPPDGYGLELVEAAVTPSSSWLDAKELAALPVLVWECDQEADRHCAVCLGEMEDGELGRLLPACGHVFHVGCIDAWLGVSSTCPLCRTPVVRTEEEDAAVPASPLC